MVVNNDLKANSINEQVKINVDADTTVISDAYNWYTKLKLIVKQNDVINTTELIEVHKALPWIESAIGNSKKILDGVHHSNGQDYLQNDLNEYCYKYNRRYFGERIFDRLLIACIENC